MPFWPVPDQVGCFIESAFAIEPQHAKRTEQTWIRTHFNLSLSLTQTINKPEKSPLRCLSVWFAFVDYLHTPNLNWLKKLHFLAHFKCERSETVALSRRQELSPYHRERTTRAASPASRACSITERLQWPSTQWAPCTRKPCNCIYVFWMEIYTTRMLKTQRESHKSPRIPVP